MHACMHASTPHGQDPGASASAPALPNGYTAHLLVSRCTPFAPLARRPTRTQGPAASPVRRRDLRARGKQRGARELEPAAGGGGGGRRLCALETHARFTPTSARCTASRPEDSQRHPAGHGVRRRSTKRDQMRRDRRAGIQRPVSADSIIHAALRVACIATTGGRRISSSSGHCRSPSSRPVFRLLTAAPATDRPTSVRGWHERH